MGQPQEPRWADELRAAMQRAGVTEQAALAAALQVTEATVSRWLNGHASPQNRKKRNDVLAKLERPTAPPTTRYAPMPGNPLLDFETDAERRAASLAMLYLAQRLVPQLGETVDSAVAALLAPLRQPAPAFPASPETTSRLNAASATSDARLPGSAASPARSPSRRKA